MLKNQDKYPDFKIALGNEIYLVNERKHPQKYFHFILLAKDEIGNRQLRELSSIAWYNIYKTGKMERVPTLKSDLYRIVKENPGHLIGTTACLGGELAQLVLQLIQAEQNAQNPNPIKQEIFNYITFCKDLFGDDFYIEVAPADAEEQIAFNKRVVAIAKAFDVKMVFATDSHYLRPEDRLVHKTYLNSKEGEREVDSFYACSYMMDDKDVWKYLSMSYDKATIEEMYANTLEVADKITHYSLHKEQKIPQVDVVSKMKTIPNTLDLSKYTHLYQALTSGDSQNEYWVKDCISKLIEENKLNDTYLSRLDTEADICNFLSERINQPLPAYFNTLQHYIDLFWEEGSIVGPGRGSAVGFLSNYLQGITQLDPVEHNLPYWRFLNKERVELPDIDIDLAPSKKPGILSKIRSQIGELNILQVATFGTEKPRSAVLTACRGYRSEDYPNGIDVDTGQYLTSLIPSHRGFLWELKDVIYGNEEEGRKPVKPFLEEVDKYPGLLQILLKLEGLVNKRSTHAAGVIFYDGNPLDTTAIMRSPSGELSTQFSLHDAEWLGDIKYDFLVTEISDKIITTLDLLTEDELVEKDLTLREKYNKYLHPKAMNLDDQRIWQALSSGSVLDVFQFNSAVGLQAAKIIKPRNVGEMTAANALMRLMGEKGKENPMERYVRMKNNPQLWIDEAVEYGLTSDEIDVMKKYYTRHYGTPPYQEDLMTVLMDEATCNFTLAESNAARKLVAKKEMDKIPAFKEKILSRAKTPQMANYIWDTLIAPQLGYGFSELHSLAYSFVGVQTLYLATNFPSVYWNTACLTVNAGSSDEDSDDQKGTDYAKVAKAIGDIKTQGINVSLININESDFGFKPDRKNNQILFGLKGVTNIGDDVVHQIISNRPYTSLADFMQKTPLGRQQMISLIKGGAFDELEKKPRQQIMYEYIMAVADTKSKLTLQNFAGLIEKNVLPWETLELQIRTFNFNKMLKKNCKSGDYYLLQNEYSRFYNAFFDEDELEVVNGIECIKAKTWDKMYAKVMDVARAWLRDNQQEALDRYNYLIAKADWDKNCSGNISSWEMDSICFYHGEHELARVNKAKYGISDFADIVSEDVDRYFTKNGVKIPIMKISRIMGTVLSKNKNKGSIALLTEDGVVDVKFRLEHFAMFDKQVSEIQDNGEKKITDKSWFGRGSKIIVTGYRRGDGFVCKKYSDTAGHSLYKIEEIQDNGDILIRHER